MRLPSLVLAVAAGALAQSANAAAPVPLAELPGVAALPHVPPLAPPQPPLVEVARLRGTVSARERVLVGIDEEGSPRTVTAVQRLLVRSLGDYFFFIPAPATSAVAEPGSESRPGLRPNQIVWQGFSPRRKVLAARAQLRVTDSASALPLRVRVAGAPTAPGPFELEIRIENVTGARVRAAAGAADEADVAEALRDLRAAARIDRSVEGGAVPIRGRPRTVSLDASAVLRLRGSIAFPSGSVRGLRPSSFSAVVGGQQGRTLVVRARGVAMRPAQPRLRVVAEPVPEAAVPASASTLTEAILGYLRYARTRQYQTYLANPDPQGPSTTTYVFETVAPYGSSEPGSTPSDGSALPAAILFGSLALLGLGAVVLWAHL